MLWGRLVHNYAGAATYSAWPDWLGARLVRFGNLSLALLLAGLTVRLVELIGVAQTSRFPTESGNVIEHAFGSDLLFFMQLLPFLLVPFLLVRLVTGGKRIEFWGYGVAGTLALVGYLILVNYFFTTRTPLGADLFGYSPSEIMTTTTAGFQVSLLTVVSFVVPLSVFWLAMAYFNTHTPLPSAAVVIALLLGIGLAYGASALPASSSFTSEYAHSVAHNKAAYFVSDIAAYFRPTSAMADVIPTASGEFTYLDPEFPFLRTDATPDGLGGCFTIVPGHPPNIVIIQVEGLGRAFSGPHAYLGSFTPFLDELAAQGLYWENFLAAQGRTFAVLPSILGSLPFADQGFNELGARMPNHLTLFSILQHNGYRTGFYCAADLDFDGQRTFLKRQNTDVMVGVDDFGAGYQRTPNSSWGYPDRELLRKILSLPPADPARPFIDYIQTMSMHTSYQIPGQEEYLRQFEVRMEQLGFTAAEKDQHRPYREIYSTILYTDAALRYYFAEQAKRPAFQNTIYIITGDHRLPEIPMSTKIDRYHVPLIIYSPLLKHPATIRSISSHLDLAPSLLAFFKHNYAFNTPDAVAWVGSGLDFEPTLRNIHHYPLKQIKTNLINYLSGLYFLDQDSLFSIGENLNLEPVQDEGKLTELRAEFAGYRARNDRFRRELKLIPDSVYAAYAPAR